MRPITFLVFSLFLSIVGCDAQTFTVKDLIGTKWEQVKDSKATTKTVVEFTDKDMIEYCTHLYTNTKFRWPRPYYFSPTIPTSFDKNKVGKVTTGRYIVILYKDERMVYKTIQKISSDTLILYRRKVNSIGGKEQTYVYKRIK